ncbi:ATP-dependent DNA helicase DinG [Robertmurraya sp. FSL W8-0741]|uniref:ATP-dependent DNA helicase DinG n=1 Tax=Robertmurraya TaxID=2837507 RepID=UPI0010F6117D|nr:ATP-dependent DNA helicase DinG [Robertmurraya siralis]
MSNKFVVVDLETTGNAPKKGDKIIQFAAVVVENGKITEQFSSFINPGREIPLFIEELTGLNDEMVRDAPNFSEIAPKVLMLLEDAYFVAHNVLFDLSFLQEELIEAGYEGFLGPVLDTVEMARFLFPTSDSYKLNELAVQEGLNHERPHQADSDAYVTAELLLILLNRLWQLPNITLHQLLKLSGGLKSDVALLLDDLIIEKERSLEEIPFSLERHRGIMLRKLEDREEFAYDPSIPYPESDEEKERLFQGAFQGYEKRIGQFQMMDTVFKAFTNEKHALIEAGTGVGKSMAYLLPAAIFASERRETIVISTHTTQLQEQLLNNDIPLLQKILPNKLKAVILKGRSHYLSLAKFEQSLQEDDDNYDISLTKMQILVWLLETETGDRDELNLSSGGMLFWGKIKNDDSTYFQQRSWIKYDYYLRARKASQTANFIITNHSFLLTDLVADTAILPRYDYCILDEGHHFEKVCGKYFGLSLDYLHIRLLLSQFGQYEQKQIHYELEQILKEKDSERTAETIHSFEVSQLFNELMNEMDQFFRTVANVAKKRVKSSAATNKVTFRLIKEGSDQDWSPIHSTGERFYFSLKDFAAAIKQYVEAFTKEELQLSNPQKLLIQEVVTLQKELETVCETIKQLILFPMDEFVTWVEVDIRSSQNSTTILGQPITIASQLREEFFLRKKSAVMTSATLSVKGSFQYMLKELGLDKLDCYVQQIESPFPYDKQVQLVIPNDLPEINSVSIDEYVAAITEHIISIAEATKGRMLILFTSYEMLRKTYNLMKESGLLEDFIIMGQGITAGSRTKLTRNFQRFDKAILLGTSSFWEGIDIPGEDLSCLIMVRLPFSPPNEPLTEAKCHKIKESGGNPFSEHSLPEAIIRFKQGFGRLIRTNQDRGFVVIFDKRIYTTSYGKVFLQSIPKVPVKKLNINATLDLIENFL